MGRHILHQVRSSIFLLILSCVAGCGQKGDLYLPAEELYHSLPSSFFITIV